jgi:hypothetical protein
MHTHPDPRIRTSSGCPWHLTLTVTRIGPDYLCLVHGGDAHVGAVALAEWGGDEVRTRCLSAGGHKEEAIARHTARIVSAATRRTATCVAGIHFDGISRLDIEEISSAAHALAREAAAELRDQSLLGGRPARAAERSG